MAIKDLKLILCLLFFFLSISSNSCEYLTDEETTSFTWIQYDYNTHTVSYSVTNAIKRQNFRLDFDNDIPRSINYVKVELKADNDIPTPILQFSSTDDNCHDGREQMAKDPNSNLVILWLKVEEFQDGDLFVLVECLTD